MRVLIEPTLPAVPLQPNVETCLQAREETLEYIAFVARNYPPSMAEPEINAAAARLIEIIKADYAATALELAEDVEG